MVAAKVGKAFEELLAGFPQAEHQPAFGLDGCIASFHVREQFQRPAVVAFGTSDASIEPRNRLHVVVEDLRGSVDDAVQSVSVSDKVRSEHFDGRAGPLANGDDASIKMLPTSIGQIVPSHRGDHHVLEP